MSLMASVHVLDLEFLSHKHTIASFLIKMPTRHILLETGPYSTFPTLEKALQAHGSSVRSISDVFLTHIHFDHAGAAWAFAAQGARIYVHPKGYAHLLDPSMLWNSAKRIYQEKMETLWGKIAPIAARNLVQAEDGQCFEMEKGKNPLVVRAWHTPGHAKHHIAWQVGGLLFCGDAAGVKLEHGPVVPPCPPPDIDMEAWQESLARMAALKPTYLYLTHYGKFLYTPAHTQELGKTLRQWALWVKEKWEQGVEEQRLIPLFEDYVRADLRRQGVSEAHLACYEAANPLAMSVGGLIRYWKKKSRSDRAARTGCAGKSGRLGEGE